MSGRPRVVAPALLPLAGHVRVPGDKSIAHRAVLFNAAAHGRAVVRGLPDGADVASTIRAVESLGCRVARVGDGELTVEGRDFLFTPPTGTIDCGNFGTTMRLVRAF